MPNQERIEELEAQVRKHSKFVTTLVLVLMGCILVGICFHLFVVSNTDTVLLRVANKNMSWELEQLKSQVSRFDNIITAFLKDASSDSTIGEEVEVLMNKYGLVLKKEPVAQIQGN